MYRILIGCILLSLLSPLLRADDIVIYRGTVRITTDAQTAGDFAKTVKAYLLVNYTNGFSNEVIYFTKVTKKMRITSVNHGLTRALLPNAKNITLFTSAAAEAVAPDNFQLGSTMLRGNDVNLLIETNPERRSIARPRSLTGDGMSILATPGQPSIFRDLTISYTLDTAKTLAANNEDKTLTNVTDEIRNALTEQGYVTF